MTMVPALAATLNSAGHLLESGRSSWLRDGVYISWLGDWYDALLKQIIARPAVGLLLGALFPVIGFMQARHLKEQFFPPADRDQLHIEIE